MAEALDMDEGTHYAELKLIKKIENNDNNNELHVEIKKGKIPKDKEKM